MQPVRPAIVRALVLAGLLPALLPVLRPQTFAADNLRVFQAGAAAVDITPESFPVIVNGMFTQRQATNAHDHLHARALVLDDGGTRLAIVVVDSCMMPRTLIDDAKARAHQTTGIAIDHMLVSATHTHSAPSVMGCLGSQSDTNYAQFLPGKIAEAIDQEAKNLAPARIGWAVTQDAEHTHCRRWIYQLQKCGTDPFGAPTVHANMHPGYLNPDVVGPAGPVDAGLSVLAVQSLDGRPIALLANYSMHYYDSVPVSADYYGLFAEKIAKLVGATHGTPPFVGIMSQGTSGDQMWMDYGRPQLDPGLDAYAAAIAQTAYRAYQRIEYHDWVPLAMRETRLTLGFRVPDDARLAWARKIVAGLHGRLPTTQTEIYAREAVFLHDRPTAELKLQAIRVGDLGIAAIPNEVFGITGLKIKAQSPLEPTFNLELANGAEGYIPPPEQHQLGGYTTWPARTAGLEVDAEPRIVETALALLEQVSGQPRRPIRPPLGPYARAVLDASPVAYWWLDEFNGPAARDSSGNQHDAAYESRIAFYLEGPPTSHFSGDNSVARAAHFAGGRLRASLPNLGPAYSVAMWFWNGLPNLARPVTGYLFSRGIEGAADAAGDHLGIGGSDEHHEGRLIFFNGNRLNQLLAGNTVITPKTWNQVVLVRAGKQVAVYLNGNTRPEVTGQVELGYPAGPGQLFIGGRNDGYANFEGKIDEVAVFDRALNASEVAGLYRASGLPPQPLAPPAPRYTMESQPKTPAESLAVLHLADGFEAELVAAEPLLESPVAIDWGVDGKLWVVEMTDYPMGMDGKMKPGGRVRFLEDTDGDGKYDKSTIFLDHANFPNGILTWRNGVLVTAAPDIFFAADTNGDGQADVRQVLFTGFREGNLQLRVNGLRWGFDTWIYCANGWSGGQPRSIKTGAQLELSGHDLRIKPDAGLIDLQSGQSEFGRNRDDWGNWFGCDNSYPLFYFPFDDDYLRRNPYLAAPDAKRQLYLPANPKVYPRSRGQKRYHSFDQAGHFTSACSADFYRDELLFPRGPIAHAFVCEPVHNLVQHLLVTEDGVSFTARRAEAKGEGEFLASEDQWFRPVMARTGPDGALWVVDMYRYMIEHPDWLPPEGKRELAPFYRAGADRGRIYRIYPKGKRPPPPPRLDRMSTPELVAELESPNGWLRDKAQQLLIWHPDPAAVGPLEKLADTAANPLARVYALFTLDAFAALKPALIERALRDSHPGVRRQALRLAETHAAAAPQLIDAAARLVADPDAKVRLQLACTLGEWTDPRAGQALARLALANASDPDFRTAIMSSAMNHCAALVQAAVSGQSPAAEALVAPLLNLSLALHRRELVAQLLGETLTPHGNHYDAAQLQAFAQFLDALARRGTSTAELMRAADDALTQQLRRSDNVLSAARRLAPDATQSPQIRAAAASLLNRDPTNHQRDIALLATVLTPQTPEEVQRAAVRALARAGDQRVPALLVKDWPADSPELRAAIVEEMLGREPWAMDFLGRIGRGEIGVTDMDAQHRDRFLKHRSERVKALAAQVFSSTVNPDRQKVIDAFRPALALAGEAARGKAIFGRLCTPCHRLDNVGHQIGPNLVSVKGHPSEKLLTSILDPSREVEPQYLAYECALTSGEELYGLIVSESGNSITLELADATTRSILRSEIASLRGTKKSLMPEGLETGLVPQDLADLIQYLRVAGSGD